MGFDEIYKAQKGVISRINSYVNEIEPYLKSLSSIVTEINTSWTSDAGEKYYIITAIQSVRKNLGNNAKNFRTFTATADVYLEQMHEFKKYNGVCRYGICNVTNIKASKSSKSKIIINTTKIKSLSTKLNSIASKIEDTASSLSTQVSRVDADLAYAVVGGKNKLQGYKNNINIQAQKVRSIAVAIKQIANNYEKTEKNLQKLISGIEQSTIDAGLVATKTAADIVSNMLNATGIVGGTDNNTYVDPKQLRKNLENLFGNIDEYVGDYDNIKDLLENVTGDDLDIPIISDLVDLYSKYKDKYKSVDDFIKAVESGKIFDGLDDPKNWAGILRDGGKAIFGKGYGFLADSAYYVTGVWTEELQELYSEGKNSGNAIKDSITLWSGVAEHVIDDAVDAGKKYVKDTIKKGENLVKGGLNSIYNTADNLAEDLFGIDLDKEYKKLGVNIRDTINNFSVDNLAKGAGNLYNKGKKALGKLGKTIAGWF